MVILDFQINEQSLRDDYETGLSDQAALLETYLILPVQFSVDGIHLFERCVKKPSVFQVNPVGQADIVTEPDNPTILSPWLDLPILGFALGCYDKVRKIPGGGTIVYDLPGGAGYLIFTGTSGKVKIESTVNGRVVEVD